jgi:hypothetical protein
MNIVQTLAADAATVIKDVQAGLTFLKTEGEKAIAWVDNTVPGAQVAMASFIQGAEADAATLTQLAGTGLNDAIAAGSADMETFIANLIQASGLVKVQNGQTATSALDALDVAGVSTLKTIGQSLVSTAIATVLGKLAPAVVATAT